VKPDAACSPVPGHGEDEEEQAEINALGKHGREVVAQLVVRNYPLLAAKIRNNTGNGIRNSLHTKRLAIDLR
jgi:hypothetical protein